MAAHVGAYAQQSPTSLQQWYADSLLTNGVVATADVTVYSFADLAKLRRADLNAYRGYNYRQEVHITNGPNVQLLSIIEEQSRGKVIDSIVVAKSRELATTHYRYGIIPVIDIGFGLKPSEPVGKGEKRIEYKRLNETY